MSRRVAPLMSMALLLGAADTAHAQEQATARTIFEKHALLGTWAKDCDSRATPANMYQVHRALADGRVQYDMMEGPAQRTVVGIVDSAVEVGPQDVQMTRVTQYRGGEDRDLMTMRVDGNHRRLMDWIQNGTKRVAAGRYLNSKENGKSRGKPTPWVHKCE